METRPENVSLDDFFIDGGIVVVQFQVHERTVLLATSPFQMTTDYRITVHGAGEKDLMPDGVLDSFVSEKPLGCRLEHSNTVFRLFAPRATQVHLVLFEKHDDRSGMEYPMTKGRDGVWDMVMERTLNQHYYGYRIWGAPHRTELFNPDWIVADPYSSAVVTQNHYLHPAKTLILPPSIFDWEGDAWICPDLEDLTVYEMHIRDMTVHPSSGVQREKAGTYLGLTETGKTGGIDYLRSLGINAVELMPAQEFGNLEIDYRNPSLPVYNDWNPYARNHWGYMTSYFFAPESYYATGGNLIPGQYCGSDGRQVREFKEMVKAFHRAGISVIMDVVYNHVSHYDFNSFKAIDKKYYFRLDGNQEFQKTSGCGNDFRTERPMVRRLITESVLHWMQEYHVDGFRFDLATLIDSQTLDAVSQKAREVNPRVILIAEPWGGGTYGQAPFSRRGWGSWNDRFRNGVKGQNPHGGLGFVFGQWWGDNSPRSMRHFILGTPEGEGGPFAKAGHSVNYLESHDDYTFGDFVRIGSVRVREGHAVTDLLANARLTDAELNIHKLGALFLLTSRGATMLHEGQEFARSKAIAKTDIFDSMVGMLDPNSYNKDNETNWINYTHADMNSDLLEYYRGLISLRKRFSVFRRAASKNIRFLDCVNPFGVGYVMHAEGVDSDERLAVLMNGHPILEAEFQLPDGHWHVLADRHRSATVALRPLPEPLAVVPPTSGMVLYTPAESVSTVQ